MSADVRAMVLAAGFGTRLRPLTCTVPKPLVTVLGRSLLELHFERLAEAGVRRVVVNLHHLAAVLRPAAEAAARRHPFELVLLEESGAILGTGGGVKNAEAHFRGADALVVLNGDSYLDVDLRSVIASHLETDAAGTMLLRENPDPVAYRPVETDDQGRIHRIAGNPAGGPDGLRPWLFAGLHILRPDTLAGLPANQPSDINRALHPRSIERGELVRGHVFTEAWWDIGTPDRLLTANLEALAGPPAHLLEVVRRAGWTVAGGVAAAADARLDPGASCARSIIGAGAAIAAGAHVEDTLVMDGARIGAGARVARSILGPGEVVPAGAVLDGVMVAAGHTPID